MHRRRNGVAILALAGALGALPAARGEESGVYVLTIRDHRFVPSEIEIPADTKITLTIKNLDSTPEEFESTQLHSEKIVTGGHEITLHIGPLKPGQYEFFGDFNPETARGHIVVK